MLATPVAKRYGSSFYKRVTHEIFFVCLLPRPLRVCLEVTANWLAHDTLRTHGFKPDTSIAGEEGFVGPAANAEAALAALLAELRTSPAFEKLFTHAAFYEKTFHPGGLPSDGAASSRGL